MRLNLRGKIYIMAIVFTSHIRNLKYNCTVEGIQCAKYARHCVQM